MGLPGRKKDVSWYLQPCGYNRGLHQRDGQTDTRRQQIPRLRI